MNDRILQCLLLLLLLLSIIVIIRNRFDLGNYLCLQHLIVTSSIALTTLLFFAESVILFRDEQTKDIRQSNNVEWLPCVQFRLLQTTHTRWTYVNAFKTSEIVADTPTVCKKISSFSIALLRRSTAVGLSSFIF